MVASASTFAVRLSPSGPEIGSPPQVVGIGDGSKQLGRVWEFQGTGTSRRIDPGTGTTNVSSFDALPVNLLPGYVYDVNFAGFTSGTGGSNYATVVGSSDGGATYPTQLEIGGVVQGSGMYAARKTDVQVTPGTTIDHLRVIWHYQVNLGNFLDYDPTQCSLVVQEFSKT
jgi:hypothetical protein